MLVIGGKLLISRTKYGDQAPAKAAISSHMRHSWRGWVIPPIDGACAIINLAQIVGKAVIESLCDGNDFCGPVEPSTTANLSGWQGRAARSKSKMTHNRECGKRATKAGKAGVVVGLIVIRRAILTP